MANTEFYRSIAGLIKQGETSQAISDLSAFLDHSPEDATAMSLLGSAYLQKGDTENALACFEKGVAAHPNSDAAHAELGFAAMKVGNKQKAVQALETATILNPAFYQAWCFLEQLHYDTENFVAAIHAAQQAETCDPFEGDYKSLQAAMRSDDKATAEKIARSILQRCPGHPRAAFVLAHLAGTIGAHEESVKILKHGLEHHPANIHVRRALVQAFEEIGAYLPAIFEAETLTRIQPDYRNWLILSRVQGHIGRQDLALEAAEKSAACLDKHDTELGKVDLLRGHALKILGRRAESEAAYHACLKNTPGNGAGWWGLADLKNYMFSAKEIAQMETLANKNEDAAQRSQTAFALGKAYENMSNYAASFRWYKLANTIRPDVTFDQNENQHFVQQLKAHFNADMLKIQAEPQPNGPTPIFILGLPRSGSTLIEQILASHSQIEGTMELTTLPKLERRISIHASRQFKEKYPASLAKFSAADLSRFGQIYSDETAPYRTDKAYFIDKLPPNYERIGLIHKIMPHAIIIDARRHPLDCGLSAYKQHFAAGHDWSYRLSDTGCYYNGYLDIMDHWDALLPGKVMCVHYEDIVHTTEATVRAVLDHVGVGFEENCLKFFENKRAVRTASSEQVRQPIYTKAISHWRNFEDHLSPLKKSLGAKTMERFSRFIPQ